MTTGNSSQSIRVNTSAVSSNMTYQMSTNTWYGVPHLADATNGRRYRIILSTLVIYYKFSCCGSTTGTRGDNLSSVHPENGKEAKHTAGFNVDGVLDANLSLIDKSRSIATIPIDVITAITTGVRTPLAERDEFHVSSPLFAQ